MVVEVTTYDNRSSGVLPDNVSGDLNHPFGSLFQVLLFSRLEVAVEDLDVLVTQFQLGPAEVCPKCLHKLQSGVGS